AAPDYIVAHGMPEGPADLAKHNCLRISTVDDWNDWHLSNGEDKFVYQAKGNFEANSADAVYHAALAGLGVARLSTYLIGPAIGAGRLVHVLPDYCEQHANIFAVYSNRRNLSPKVRVFIDYLVDSFHPVPPWERSEAG
ncbi:MAG: substrate binding domain-containing protein, partial [Aestuariivirgaceae bacterium]